jgi:hypothetical protein
MGAQTTFIRAFPIDPYRWHLYLFNDRAKWAKFCTRKMGGQGYAREAAQAGGIVEQDEINSSFYVGIFDFNIGTLAHEMTHVSLSVLQYAGVPIEGDGEPLAYLVGHLVDECKIAVED